MLRDPTKAGRLEAAGTTPRSPKVQDENVTPKVGHAEGTSSFERRNREIGGCRILGLTRRLVVRDREAADRRGSSRSELDDPERDDDGNGCGASQPGGNGLPCPSIHSVRTRVHRFAGHPSPSLMIGPVHASARTFGGSRIAGGDVVAKRHTDTHDHRAATGQRGKQTHEKPQRMTSCSITAKDPFRGAVWDQAERGGRSRA
jgi:hypothetical protein